jgi:hypothetical protein
MTMEAAPVHISRTGSYITRIESHWAFTALMLKDFLICYLREGMETQVRVWRACPSPFLHLVTTNDNVRKRNTMAG